MVFTFTIHQIKYLYFRHVKLQTYLCDYFYYQRLERHNYLNHVGRDLATYASEKIWAPYGMEQDASWMLDRTGHEHGGCCIQAATRDFARLGQFVLDGARIDGQPVVADGWLEAATRKQVDIGQPGRGYGYQWWTVDNGTWYAFGIHGQQVHVDPGRRVVVAFNSAWPTAYSAEAVAARAALILAIRKAIDSETQGK